jgi:hypothetical protein
MNERIRLIWIVYLLLYILVIAFKEIAPSFGLILPLLFLADFLVHLGKKIPVRELILSTIAVQCLLVPYLYYADLLITPDIYKMAVPEEKYFGFMVPAFLLFSTGLSIGKEGAYVVEIENKNTFFRIGRVLIITGVITEFLIPFTPPAFRFFVLLIGNFKFVGALYVLFSEHRKYYIWVGIAFLQIFVNSLSQAFFQELLGWSMFFVLYFFHKKQTPKLQQLALISVLLVGIFILQHVKGGYRITVHEQEVGVEDRVNTFLDQYIESSTSDETFSEESLNHNFVRFNQGYIISRIMNHVPRYEPFAEGATIMDALYSSFVPRFLDPNKTTVGGGNGLYTRFTGFELIGGTSKDLSIFGEIYANYGVSRGILVALLVGLFYNLALTILMRSIKHDAQLIFWIPYLFLIMVRPENGFVAVLNHFSKAAVVAFLFYYIYLKQQPLSVRLGFRS